jgi:hypothetical protein
MMATLIKDMKQDARPQRHWWAPGGYVRLCRTCFDWFLGDKRAMTCADCAYTDSEPCGKEA